jgi:hypothetical protein
MRRGRQTGRWLPLFAVAGLLVLAWFLSTVSSPGITQLPLELETGPSASAGYASDVPSAPPSVPPEETSPGSGAPEWILLVAAILCGLIAVGLIGALAIVMLRGWQARERPLHVDTDAPTAMSGADEVMAALDAGIEQLSDSDADPRRAVIACWVRLEQAAATAGTPRHIGDTPAELVGRLLGAHRVSRPVLARFAAVYREARYATHPVDEQMRQTAIGALRQLRAELAEGLSRA